MDERLAAWWRLRQVRGVGVTTLYQLREQLGSLDALLACTPDELLALGLQPAAVQQYQQQPLTDVFYALLDWQAEPGQGVLTCDDSRYPTALASLSDAPLWLYWRGNPALLQQPLVAMVGSRNPTPYARDWARQCAADLAQAGVCVVSGMALGIDAAAHQGALDSGGSTVAVLGCGADVVYPKRHRQLYNRIRQQGLVLSELPAGTQPQASFFPGRNRIVSGLCQAVVVVEAAIKSGSLITARLAAQQGREVMALPGAVTNPLAAGCHQLIRDGALLVRDAEDILQELALFDLTAPPAPVSASSTATATPTTASPAAPALVTELDFASTTSLDVLAIRTGESVSSLMANLLELELEGWLVQEPGGYRRLR
ncbi:MULTISPECIES: DNA-processing protein DprA [unclassified Oceanobacter]|uniref:DNA-processing protein DprA n=2 Tax=Gammaproteobacteria TaxID=1236 RepID=UPI0027364135|nr:MULTISPECIES: DNA-processing protein DprA [unclassified Oceanobacter]MDP2607736.1 DNA-processing protein DprA [Oceanobacter sp. 1_MG-2023]MDP2611080.1 DNA-processing protein DprA [Oceanobacter sp. 2_MG-2023]